VCCGLQQRIFEATEAIGTSLAGQEDNMNKKLRLLIWLLCFLCVTNSQAQPQDRSIGVDEILKAVQRHPKQLVSARAESVESKQTTPKFQQMFGIDARQPLHEKRLSRWAFKGSKLFEQQTEIFSPKGQKPQHKLLTRMNTDIYDGQRYYTTISSRYTGFANKVVQTNIHDRNNIDMMPMKIGYKAFGRDLIDILRDQQFQLVGTTMDSKHGRLYQFANTGQAAGQAAKAGAATLYRVWIAPKYGSLAVRSEKENHGVNGHTMLVMEMSDAQRQGSLWFPTAGKMTWFQIANGQKTPLLERKFIVNHFKLNTVPDALFVYKPVPGEAVQDGDTNQQWKIGANGERISVAEPQEKPKGPSPAGWLFVASSTTILMMGMTLLCGRPSGSSS
jgi:hypothetical protein